MDHKEALLELARMKEAMEQAQQERDETIAEVEAQIEKALASMAVEMDESDYISSRPNSRLSSTSRPPKSRRSSDATPNARPLRSIGTDSTLAESYGGNGGEEVNADTSRGDVQTQDEGSEGKPNKKRFSASQVDVFQDSMNAVDEGISLKSDNIAQKVFEIEQKVNVYRADRKEATHECRPQLETALASEHRSSKRKNHAAIPERSEEEPVVPLGPRSRPTKGSRTSAKHTMKNRTRSGTASSTQTGTSTQTDEGTVIYSRSSTSKPPETRTNSPRSDSGRDEQIQSTPEQQVEQIESSSELLHKTSRSPAPPLSTTAVSLPNAAATTDESDTDFQSAYSTSPRESYVENDDDLHTLDSHNEGVTQSHRERVFSTSTAIDPREHTRLNPSV